MARTLMICGYGSGISEAVARKFGEEGFAVALVARSEDKVEAGAAALRERGIEARGFAHDLSAPQSVGALVEQVRAALGPVTVLHWNAYAGSAGDLSSCPLEELGVVLNVGVTSMVAAVQAALPDMQGQPDAAVLVTGGGFAFYDPQVDSMVVQWSTMGLAVAKAAQHKLAGLLHEKLKERGVYVGEVVVTGLVKGTAFDSGQATIEPSAVAERFWELHQGRSERSVTI